MIFVRRSSSAAVAVALFSVFLLAGCSQSHPKKSAEPSPVKISESSTWPHDDDGQWMMPAKDYASTRFSGLSEINTGSVKNLKVAWTFSTGNVRGHEAAPLVVNNTMFIVTPFPNVVYALEHPREDTCTYQTAGEIPCRASMWRVTP